MNGLDGASAIISAQVIFIICYPLLFQTISSVQVDEVVDAINDTFNKIVRLVQTNIFIFNLPGRGN